MASKGSLLVEGEHATLEFRRFYPHPIALVWEAISTPEGLREWLLCSYAKIDGRVGGTIELISGPSRYHSSGKILAWEPPRLLEYEWNVAAVPEMPRGERAIFRYELATRDGGTELWVRYQRITRETARGFLPGLHAFLDRLEAQLAGQPLPDWLARFAELQTSYPEWSAHASASRE